MNTSEILNQTLAWLYYKDQESPGSMWDISSFLNTLGLKTESQLIGLELAERGYLRTYFRYETRNSFNAAINMSGIQQVAPKEVHALTQVILNTLNSEPEKYHDLSEIPGLESKEWAQLAEFARYLLKQGWIEANSREEKLFVKLTIKGSIYLRNQDTIA
ncbi:hypothetical protein [Adhaeribacter aquaticus]|uniref:hypothetical protein n=1 Tax=Adhaeribacter aquaticus TaxID=299567 RepID=UPI0003FD9528|nr:hypothetical protein [Adhaeribacter aquaticus]